MLIDVRLLNPVRSVNRLGVYMYKYIIETRSEINKAQYTAGRGHQSVGPASSRSPSTSFKLSQAIIRQTSTFRQHHEFCRIVTLYCRRKRIHFSPFYPSSIFLSYSVEPHYFHLKSKTNQRKANLQIKDSLTSHSLLFKLNGR